MQEAITKRTGQENTTERAHTGTLQAVLVDETKIVGARRPRLCRRLGRVGVELARVAAAIGFPARALRHGVEVEFVGRVQAAARGGGNADEGDPGAFMDRSAIEGDPHTIVEGMTIGGYAIGAQQGFVYIRAEYPLAIRRIRKAIEDAEEARIATAKAEREEHEARLKAEGEWADELAVREIMRRDAELSRANDAAAANANANVNGATTEASPKSPSSDNQRMIYTAIRSPPHFPRLPKIERAPSK